MKFNTEQKNNRQIVSVKEQHTTTENGHTTGHLSPVLRQVVLWMIVLFLMSGAGAIGCGGSGGFSREVESNMNKNLFTRPYRSDKGSYATPKPTTSPKPESTPKSSKSRSGTKKNDPYGASDYSHLDDFYYDHYDDFWDYEDAEDYWEEYED